jgi:RpiR family carbohydrate utilization transcriptional regulator
MPTADETASRPEGAALPQTIRLMLNAGAGLRPAERKVVDYLVQNQADILRMTVTDVAEGSGTSEATVVRVCKKGGVDGFQQFKIRLAQELVAPLKAIHEEVAEGDDIGAVARKVFHANILALEDTLAQLPEPALVGALAILERADQILLCGVGNSGLIALDAQQRWLRLGLQVAAEVAGDTQAVRAALLRPQDAVVAISHSGASRDVVEAARTARRNGAQVVAVTHFGKSPLTRLADVVLPTAARETAFRTEAMSSRIAMQTIMDLLFVALALRRYETTVDNIMRIRAATAARRL